jgi:hypothetical protein
MDICGYIYIDIYAFITPLSFSFLFFFLLPAIISAGGVDYVIYPGGFLVLLAFPYTRKSSPRGKDGWLAGWLVVMAGGDGHIKMFM